MAENKKSGKMDFETLIYLLLILGGIGYFANLGIRDIRDARILKKEKVLTVGKLERTEYVSSHRDSNYRSYYAFFVDGEKYYAERNIFVSSYEKGLDSIPEFVEIEYARSDPSINRVVKKKK